MSLPLAFSTKLHTIPAEIPYLHAPADAVATWEARLARSKRPLIGLVWAGRPDHLNDRNRSIALATLLPLTDFDATFVSLQKDLRPGDEDLLGQRPDILEYGRSLSDLADAGALVSCLDLVIAVDTCLAHVAGALGKPVFILLPHTPDWRWLLDRDDSPWYPTARLFRQSQPGAWDEVVAEVASALPATAHSRVEKKPAQAPS
jgi:Glycosyltransferase family 9 (heptosyltransferase)